MDRCIADEVIRQLPRENLLSLVSYCADGLHYLASPNFFPDDLNLPAKIAVFAVRSEFVGTEIRSEVREMAQVITVVATPLPPNMRVQIWCKVDWFNTVYGRRFQPAFTPCQVGEDIMRYLLRMIEGNERADAWQPLRGKLSTEFSPVLQPITLNWRISELKRWVEDFRSDTNSDILLFHSEAKGYIDIYNEYPSPSFGLYCERPVNGAIELIPYLMKGAKPAAIAELQKWRDALEAATAEHRQGLTAAVITPIEVDPAALGIRARQLGIRPDTLMRWERILQVHLPQGLTQAQIGELEDRDIETIKDDYERMRAKGLMPPLPEKPTLKFTP